MKRQLPDLAREAPAHLRRSGEGLALDTDMVGPVSWPRFAAVIVALMAAWFAGLWLGIALLEEPWTSLGNLPGLAATGVMVWRYYPRRTGLHLDRDQLCIGAWSAPIEHVRLVEWVPPDWTERSWLSVETVERTWRWQLSSDSADAQWFANAAQRCLEDGEALTLLLEEHDALDTSAGGLDPDLDGVTATLDAGPSGPWVLVRTWLVVVSVIATALLGLTILTLGTWTLAVPLCLWGVVALLHFAIRRAPSLPVTIDPHALTLGAWRIPLHRLERLRVASWGGRTWLIAEAAGQVRRWPLAGGVDEARRLSDLATRLAARHAVGEVPDALLDVVDHRDP